MRRPRPDRQQSVHAHEHVDARHGVAIEPVLASQREVARHTQGSGRATTPEPSAVFLGPRTRYVLSLCAAASTKLARAPLVKEVDGPAVHEMREERFSSQPDGLMLAIARA